MRFAIFAVLLSHAFSVAAEVTLVPASTTIVGTRGGAQLLLSQPNADGGRDLARQAKWVSSAPDIASVEPGGYVRAIRNGEAIVTATVGGVAVSSRVEVAGCDKPCPIAFRDEIIPALNRAGCNQGACHGTPNGKGGFKLSLRGFDVPLDYKVLSRDVHSRRINNQNPSDSLILQKGAGLMPHQGGIRWTRESPEYQLFENWLVEGLRNDPENAPTVASLEVFPGKRLIHLGDGDNDQQVSVIGRFTDGSTRDLTRLCAFSSSNDEVASVGPTGLVHPDKKGEIAVICRYLHIIQSARLTFVKDRADFAWPNPKQVNSIDKLVDDRLKTLQLTPSGISTDSEFMRRVYLDLLGVLPEAAEAKAFLADTAADKRAKLVDALLERPEYADFWAMKWSDLFRLNEAFMDARGIRDFHGWILASVKADKPLDQFVREVLSASGSTIVAPQANFFRAMATPAETAEVISQLFLGVRMNCCKCHNHPFERWTQDEYYGMAAIFASVKIENALAVRPMDKKAKKPSILSLDAKAFVKHQRTEEVMKPIVPGGKRLDVATGADPRHVFVDWMMAKDNPFFAKTMANRIWFHLMGRGIVDPVDDFRDSNPSANDPLLESLAKDLSEGGWKLKPLIRKIVASRVYQASASTNDFNREDTVYFSHTQPRLLTAEQMLDAISSVTGVSEAFARQPGVPRAVLLMGADVDNKFLSTFNRPMRRLACECERERDSNLSQALQLISSPMVQEKLASSTGRVPKLLAAGKTDREIIEVLFLAALTRYPAAAEIKAVEAALKAGDRREVLEDLTWSLLNTKEFQFRH